MTLPHFAIVLLVFLIVGRPAIVGIIDFMTSRAARDRKETRSS